MVPRHVARDPEHLLAGLSSRLRRPDVGFALDCVAKLSLRRRLSRDSVDQDLIRGSGR